MNALLRRFIFAAATYALSGCTGASAPPLTPNGLAPNGLAPASLSNTLPQTIRITRAEVERARAAGAMFVAPLPPAGKFAKKIEPINPKGGTLTAPVYGGFKASFTYPKNDAPKGQTITLETSTSDVFNAPQPSSGTPIWYLQAELNGFGTVDFQSGNGSAQISQKSLDPNKTYSVWGFVPIFGNQPIFMIEAGSPNSHHVLSFSSPLNGASIPDGVILDVELVQN